MRYPVAMSFAPLLAFALLPAAAAPAPEPVVVPVMVAPQLGETHSGRLIVFAKRVGEGSDEEQAKTVDTSVFDPTGTAVASREVTDLRPETPALVGGETDAFPTAFSNLPPGTYRIQAVLDGDHSYGYGGRGEGDLESPVVTAVLPGRVPALTLDHVVPGFDLAAVMARQPAEVRQRLQANMAAVLPIDFQSTVMTRFRGTPSFIKGWVALPPGYDKGSGTYPTVYSDGGFGSTLMSAQASAANMRGQMAVGDMPPMIWVFLDHHIATGTHEFADSANNGPWGTALTTELIPALERKYRMDARANGRFLTGHSSGGWSTLWLQVSYPKIFGGTWPTAPDPADFHDFTNVDLYAAGANFYHGPDGKPLPLVRDKGKVVATLEQFARLEHVLGEYGGQFASFEWVFSPRCPDGRPCPIFDRATGAVDPKIAEYWRDNYDIAYIVRRDWEKVKPDLDGKIHLTVGTADTFYLDGPARRLNATLDALGAKADFRFVPGRTHFDLSQIGDDRMGLMKQIAKEMYAIARPATPAGGQPSGDERTP